MIKSRLDPLRKLARSSKYQNLYSMAKELSCVHLFENITDFSKIQLDFLFWMSLYNRLYCELAIHDSKYLTKDVIEDDFACECYLIWERIKKPKLEKQELDVDNPKGKKKKKSIDPNSKVPSVVFTRGRK